MCAMEACWCAGTDVLLMRLRDEDVEILEENQASLALALIRVRLKIKGLLVGYYTEFVRGTLF